jgi:hypothetical protein
LAHQSIHGSFIAGDPTQVCQRVVWGILKAHEIMADFKKHGYRHHPSIASELVKCLAVNTSFELLRKMMTKAATMESEILDLKRAGTGATKASPTTSNKADSLKKLVEILAKQVAALESKK